jgi:hypothetical protein
VRVVLRYAVHKMGTRIYVHGIADRRVRSVRVHLPEATLGVLS